MGTSPVSTVGQALRRGLWLIVLITLAGGGVAYAAARLRPPVYEASTLVSIDEGQNASQGFDVAMQADQFLAQRFISLATSRGVLQDVCAREGSGCDPVVLARQVRVTTPKATAQLQILADASSPSTAARLANELADALIARNRALVDQQLSAQRTEFQGQLKRTGDQLTQALQQVSASEAAGRADAAGLSQLSFLQTQYAITYQRLQDLDMQRSQRANLLSVIQKAVPPRTPVDPDPVRYVLVGLAGGLAAGLLAALLVGGRRTRIKGSADLAEAAGTDVVIDFTGSLLPGSGRPYAYLARLSLAGPAEQPPAVLLVGSTLGERVNDVARELANVVVASGRRVLVLLAPTASRGSGWWRRRNDRSSRVLVEPNRADGEPDARPADDVDLVIHCSLPPMLDPSVTWLRPTPDRAILVATKGATRFGEARRAVEMLGHVHVDVIAAILLPLRMKPAGPAPTAGQPLAEPEPSPAATAALEQ